MPSTEAKPDAASRGEGTARVPAGAFPDAAWSRGDPAAPEPIAESLCGQDRAWLSMICDPPYAGRGSAVIHLLRRHAPSRPAVNRPSSVAAPDGARPGFRRHGLAEEFRSLRAQLDLLRAGLGRDMADAMLVLRSAPEVRAGKRREFSKPTRSLFLEVAGSPPFGGLCPCCGAAGVVAAGGRRFAAGVECDHWFGPALNGPEHGWPICRACHVALTGGTYLDRSGRTQRRFRTFQDALLPRLRPANAVRAAARRRAAGSSHRESKAAAQARAAHQAFASIISARRVV